MNIKISRLAVIDNLNAALRKRVLLQDQYNKANEAHDKALSVWGKKVMTIVAKINGTVDQIRHYGDSINVTITFDKELILPVRPEMKVPDGWSWETSTEIEEITQALKLLNMSDQEHVNASVYKNVVRFL